MKSVGDILRVKGRNVSTISPGATVFEALTHMAGRNIGALVVLDGETIVGIISERDYARKVILQGKSSREIPVREIMTSVMHTVRTDSTIELCMSLMTDKHVRHLPVVEGKRLIGIVSIGDVVKALLDDKETMIKDLKNYITGGR
ncbi:MAG TPA: CBS domain-containing protein [Bacteroidota bacterium]|nr:CBS domain-containing protein [Bacteroidota bacterium]